MNNKKNIPVTVCMSVYNSEKYLREAIESILNQTFSDFEFLIVNDGSTDNSLEILKNYEKQDPRIKLVNHQQNKGWVEVANEEINLAQGEFFARMDPDDISMPNRIELQYNFMINHPQHVCVGAKVLMIDMEGDALKIFPFYQTHQAIDSAHLRGEGGAMVHPAAMFRLKSLKQLGGFDSASKPVEDFDLFLRLAELGEIENLPEVLLKYRQHLHSFTSNVDKNIQFNANQKVILDACKRRNISIDCKNIVNNFKINQVNYYRRWAWWALESGNLKTARKYAFKAIQDNIFSIENWRVFICSLRGY